MASNTASPLRVELGHVDNLHVVTDADSEKASVPAKHTAHGPSQRLPRRFSNADHAPSQAANGAQASVADIAPFAALAARHGRPLRVAILSDFTRIPYANGAAFQTRFLYQELRRCGHEVTVIGPKDPDTTPDELPEGTIELPALPLKTYPGVHLPMPLEAWVWDPTRWNFDIVFAQTTSLLMEFGVWLRKMKGIPLLCVNTTHLAAAYDVLLPERLSQIEAVHATMLMAFQRPFEKLFTDIYNNSDGLVVLSEGLRSYWRERGVTAPIHVIPRAVQPEIFDKPLGPDPFTHLLANSTNGAINGPRLLCAGRHTREKAQDRVIRIFARHVSPRDPNATLTLLGTGPDTELYERVARDEGVEDRVFFAGEVPFTQMADFYAYADVFVHASLSETYGNVMGEALWCGTPTVAFADGMGVTSQIRDGHNGILLAPGTQGKGGASEAEADAAFGRAVLELVRDPQLRARLGQAASKGARERSSPIAVQTRLADAFQHAQDHYAACGLRPASNSPRAVRWYTTFRHFRPWLAISGGIYLFGHLRPGKKLPKQKLHPQIAGNS